MYCIGHFHAHCGIRWSVDRIIVMIAIVAIGNGTSRHISNASRFHHGIAEQYHIESVIHTPDYSAAKVPCSGRLGMILCIGRVVIHARNSNRIDHMPIIGCIILQQLLIGSFVGIVNIEIAAYDEVGTCGKCIGSFAEAIYFNARCASSLFEELAFRCTAYNRIVSPPGL